VFCHYDPVLKRIRSFEIDHFRPLYFTVDSKRYNVLDDSTNNGSELKPVIVRKCGYDGKSETDLKINIDMCESSTASDLSISNTLITSPLNVNIVNLSPGTYSCIAIDDIEYIRYVKIEYDSDQLFTITANGTSNPLNIPDPTTEFIVSDNSCYFIPFVINPVGCDSLALSDGHAYITREYIWMNIDTDPSEYTIKGYPEARLTKGKWKVTMRESSHCERPVEPTSIPCDVVEQTYTLVVDCKPGMFNLVFGPEEKYYNIVKMFLYPFLWIQYIHTRLLK
jgi:hypothetical protein